VGATGFAIDMIGYRTAEPDGEFFCLQCFAVRRLVNLSGKKRIDKIKTVERDFFKYTDVEELVTDRSSGSYPGVVSVL
jgi:hypothetical protein